ncbi:hypothetical protein ABFV05_005143 [Capra hircus]
MQGEKSLHRGEVVGGIFKPPSDIPTSRRTARAKTGPLNTSLLEAGTSGNRPESSQPGPPTRDSGPRPRPQPPLSPPPCPPPRDKSRNRHFRRRRQRACAGRLASVSGWQGRRAANGREWRAVQAPSSGVRAPAASRGGEGARGTGGGGRVAPALGPAPSRPAPSPPSSPPSAGARQLQRSRGAGGGAGAVRSGRAECEARRAAARTDARTGEGR